MTERFTKEKDCTPTKFISRSTDNTLSSPHNQSYITFLQSSTLVHAKDWFPGQQMLLIRLQSNVGKHASGKVACQGNGKGKRGFV